MIKCSFCGYEHDEDRKYCPDTGEKIDVHNCNNKDCGKLIDSHFSECPHCGTFQFNHDAYIAQHSAELYHKAINFSESQYRGVHAADWRDTPESLYREAAQCGHTENMYKACLELQQLNRGEDAIRCLSIFLEWNPHKVKDEWVIKAGKLLWK